jgi:hypothetical protein
VRESYGLIHRGELTGTQWSLRRLHELLKNVSNMTAIFWVNRVNPGIGTVIEFLTLPSKQFLVSRADVNRSRRIWRYDRKTSRMFSANSRNISSLCCNACSASAFGDVDESYHRTNQTVALTYRKGAILNWEARAVSAKATSSSP